MFSKFFHRTPGPLVVFIHIPKTSGTTLCHFIRRHYRKTECLSWYRREEFASGLAGLAPKIRHKTKFVFGHFNYGIDRLIDRQVQYFTVLRHPVDRAISFYEFSRARQSTGGDTPEVVRYAREHTIIDFVERFKGVSNGQTRILSGCGNNLEQAMENLHNCFFGIQDYTDQFAAQIAQRLGFPSKAPGKINTTRYQSEYTSGLREQLEEMCANDMKLYQYARALYLEKYRPD